MKSVENFIHHVDEKYNIICDKKYHYKTDRLIDYIFDHFNGMILLEKKQFSISTPTDSEDENRIKNNSGLFLYRFDKKLLICDDYHGWDFDKKISWLIHELCHIFVFSNKVNKFLYNLNNNILRNDPKLQIQKNCKIYKFRYLMESFNEYLADYYFCINNKQIFINRISTYYESVSNLIDRAERNNRADNFINYVTLIRVYEELTKNSFDIKIEIKFKHLNSKIQSYIRNSGFFNNPQYLISKFRKASEYIIDFDEQSLCFEFEEIIKDSNIIPLPCHGKVRLI